MRKFSVCRPMEKQQDEGASAALPESMTTVNFFPNLPQGPKAHATTPIEPSIVSILHLICQRDILGALDPVCRLPQCHAHDNLTGNEHD